MVLVVGYVPLRYQYPLALFSPHESILGWLPCSMAMIASYSWLASPMDFHLTMLNIGRREDY